MDVRITIVKETEASKAVADVVKTMTDNQEALRAAVKTIKPKAQVAKPV